MATQTVAAAGGNWSSSATWAPGSVPATGDDVVLNASSGQLTIDVTTNNVRSIVETSYTGTVTHNAAVTLNIGTGTAPVSNVALVFAGTYTIANATTSAIAITDTSAATNTYNFNGATLGNVTINNGTTTTTQLITSGFTVGSTATVTLTQGGFNTNGQTCSWGILSSSNSNTRVLTLGVSSVSLTAPSVTAWNLGNSSGITLSAGSSTINMTGGGQSFNGGGLTYNNVVYNNVTFGPNGIIGGNTFNNLTFNGSATTTNVVTIASTVTTTVLGIFTVNGNSVINRVLVRGFNATPVGPQATISAANTSFSNVDFMDINAIGTANWNLSGITGGSGDCGHNTGIIFTPAVNQTWQGQVGSNWSTNLWTTRIPLPQDNVFISEEFQSGQTIIMDMPRPGRSLSFVGTTGNPILNLATTIYFLGNLTLVSGITITGANPAVFWGRSNYSITSAGSKFSGNVYIDCGLTTNSYTLNDNLNCAATLVPNSGIFNANGMNVTFGTFSTATQSSEVDIIGTRIVNMGSGIWNNAGNGNSATPWSVSTTQLLTLNAQTSTINLTNSTSTNYTFIGGTLTYGTITFSLVSGSEGSFTLTGNNTFAQLTINSPNTVLFTAGSTTTCSFFACNGSLSANNVLRSTINNFPWNLNVLAGYSCSNTDIKDSNASGSRIQP